MIFKWQKKGHPIYGVMLMILAQFFLVGGWVIIKALGKHLPVFELVFFRGLFGLIPLFMIMLKRKESLLPKISNKRDMFLRCIFGSTSMILYFFALTELGIGNTSTLLNTSPIFIAVLAPFLLKEKFSSKQFWMIMVSFGFVLLVLKPERGIFDVGAVFALISGLFAAIAMMEVRRLRNTDSPTTITAYFSYTLLVISLIPMLYDFVMPRSNDWIMFILLGLTVTSYQLTMTKAYSLAKATKIAPFVYASVILSYLCDMFIFGKAPDFVSIIGAVGIIACGIAIILSSKGELQEGNG